MKGLQMVPFSSIAEINPPTEWRHLDSHSAVSFIPMSDVTETGQWVGRQKRRLADVSTGYTVFRENDVLFAKITPCMENGKGAHALGLTNQIGFGSTEFHVIRAKGGSCTRFLFHWLQNERTRIKAQSFMGGSAGQQRVQAEFFHHYQIPQLESEQQTRIARILDTADALIAKSEAILAKLRQVRSGLLQDLLTRGLDAAGRLRDSAAHPEQFKDSPLGRIPKEWEIDLLVNRISFPEGQVDPRYAPYNGYTLIAPDHIESETGRQLAIETAEEQGAISGKYLFQAGDVLYSKIRPYLRKAVLAQESGLCSADMYPLRPREGVNANYLLAVILGEDFSRFASAVSMRSGFPKINRQEMAGYSLAWPPSKEQNAIATHLANHDRLIAAEQSEISKLRQLKSGLMTVLLEGRVRVPDEARQVNPDDYPRGRASGRS